MNRELSALVIGTEVSSGLLAEHPKDVILVTYGIKKKDDDNFIKTTGEGSAKLLGVKANGVSTGKELIKTMENAGRIAVYVNWGHSWDVGLYLTSGNGFYINSYTGGGGLGEAKLQDLLASNIKTRKHTLFFWASCGTAGAYNINFEESFAYRIGDYIKKENDIENKEGIWYYKITSIGATALSNLFWDNDYYNGKIKTDGTFKKIEKRYKITKKKVYKTVTTGWWLWEEKKKVFSHFETKTEIVQTKITDLGKKIDVTNIIKNHDPESTSI